MSDLLEQAIIDATALKEAAIKSAENALIEKYSQEFKSTVERLLEQEQLATPAPAAGAAPPPAMDPAAAPQDPNMAAAPTDPSAQAMPTDPSQAAGGVPGAEDAEDPLSKIPAAFADADEDDLITIDFKGIKDALNEMLGVESLEEEDARGNKSMGEEEEGGDPRVVNEDGDEGGDDGGGSMDEELELEELELEELELEEDMLEEEGMQSAITSEDEAQTSDSSLTPEEKAKKDEEAKKIEDAKKAAELADAQAKQVAAQKAFEAAKQQVDAKKLAMQQIAEDVEISDEELEALAEELRVDINVDAQTRGYMGSTTTEKRLQRDAELAAARDSAKTAEREEELKKMQDLVNENQQLKSLNGEMLTLLEGLKVQIEKMNLSNAKLLYTNKALVNISLNERQKNHIVESISKAGSVLEAKTVYETLQSTVESVKNEEKAPKSLSEALNRAQSPFVVRKSPANTINDMQSQRMKLLAGIKTNK